MRGYNALAHLIGDPGARIVSKKFKTAGDLRRASVIELNAAGLAVHRCQRLVSAFKLAAIAASDSIPGRMVNGVGDVIALAQALFESADVIVEELIVLGMTATNQVKTQEVVARGRVNRLSTSPADLLRPIIRDGLPQFIMCHNHPSGSPEPSAQDIALTHRAAATADIMGVRLVDHIIVGGAGAHVSLLERGLITYTRPAEQLAAEGQP
jgi:DNA repair protein RadC